MLAFDPANDVEDLDAAHVHAAPWRGRRSLELAITLGAAIATAPLVAALAALIAIDSPGSPFFVQSRVGRNRRTFALVKLRTMKAGKMTRVGRWLRPTGLDELPQLWNVLRGEMSLVGPRPEIPLRVERYARELRGYHRRHRVPPGITGWAQVNGLRGNVSIAKRLQHDLAYVRDASPRLDAVIIVRTIATIVQDTYRAWRGVV